MRRQPLNYIFTIALGSMLWLAGAILAGNYFGENLTFNEITPDDFLGLYRIVLAVAAGAAVAVCWIWYFYGARPTTAAKIKSARRLWFSIFALLVLVAGSAVGVIAIRFLREPFAMINYLSFFGIVSVLTYGLFWIATFFMSPPTVEYVVPGK
jgi:hypothetical protein